MAFPEILKIVLQDQVILSIVGAQSFSRKNIAHYDDSTYRNTFANHYIELKPGGITVSSYDTYTSTLQDPATVAGVTVVYDANNNTYASRIIVDDVAAAVPPRLWKKVRTRIEFWDGEDVGREMHVEATLVNGNATITVPDNSLLTPGQTVTGTGIHPDCIIMSIPVDSTTTAILSHKATAGVSSDLTLGGSSYLGGYWEDEALGDAEDAFILQ